MASSRPEIRLLTYQRTTNPGAVLFSISAAEALRRELSGHRVRNLDYMSPRRRLYQALKAIKPELPMLLFNVRRQLTYARFLRQELRLDRSLSPFVTNSGLAQYLQRADVAAAIVGMDTWNISKHWYLESFPSAYWLPGRFRGRKVAYSVSAHRSNLGSIEAHKDEVRALLDDFALVGARDYFTLELLSHVGVRRGLSIHKVLDPTFLMPSTSDNKGNLREKFGLDSRPIVGLLTYGRSRISKATADVFRSSEYQIVAPSMHNPYADRNLGHRMDPYEWAAFFGEMDFCVTDRYHGAIFCIKARTPFLAVEPSPLESPLQSKQRSLLMDFDLLDCYLNPHVDKVGAGEIKSRLKHIQSRWDEWLPSIEVGISEVRRQHKAFLAELKTLLTDGV